MKTILNIECDDVDSEDLQQLTHDLCRTINRETDAEASLPEEAASVGAKGDVITLGNILLTALSSGTVVALINVLRTYFQRKPTLTVEFQVDNGRTVKIAAEQLGNDQIGQTLETVVALCEE